MTTYGDLLNTLNTNQSRCLSKNYANTLNRLRDLGAVSFILTLSTECGWSSDLAYTSKWRRTWFVYFSILNEGHEVPK